MYRLAGLLLSLCFALVAGHGIVAQVPVMTSLMGNPSRILTASGQAVPAQESIAAGRLVVFYQGGVLPRDTSAVVALVAARAATHLPALGISTLTVVGDVAAAAAQLRALPGVAAVLQDRVVHANRLEFAKAVAAPTMTALEGATANASQTRLVSALSEGSSTTPLGRLPVSILMAPAETLSTGDLFYDSPQGWAVQQAGGFGDGIPGGPATGPWTVGLGAGVRIAVLDTGVDEHHPDIAPNLGLNLSEVDQTALPSPCDDGSTADQMGHGTWVASLAAGAVGPSTGEVIGMAPQATLLNIKVMQRMPGAGTTAQAQCEAGTGSGLISWVLQGINDAVTNRADVIVLSLSTMVDITTGDGAGWLAAFNQVTYAAQQAGTVIVAAAGNDGLDLSRGQYVELPAQARGVLPVVAATNPACAENVTAGAVCAQGAMARASYSNYGIAGAVAAPGGNLPAGSDYAVSGLVRGACANGLVNTAEGLPANGGSFGCFGLGHVGYVQAMGTSASAPLVAGAAALLHAAHGDWSAPQIVAALQATATQQGKMVEPAINLAAALAQR